MDINQRINKLDIDIDAITTNVNELTSKWDAADEKDKAFYENRIRCLWQCVYGHYYSKIQLINCTLKKQTLLVI